MHDKILAIIQARMGSSRLHRKTLVEIEGVPLLEHVVNRICHSKTINNTIIATTTKSEDKTIISLAEKLGIDVFAGSSRDVLDRYYQSATLFKGKIIVRITADDPFKDPKIIDEIVNYFLMNKKLDYVSNCIEPTYPIGIDVEVFKYEALKMAWEKAVSSQDREHVTPYIRRKQNLFNIANYKNNENLSHLRWTIDTAEDLKMAKEVYRKLYVEGEIFYMDEILKLIRKHPYISSINRNIKQVYIN